MNLFTDDNDLVNDNVKPDISKLTAQLNLKIGDLFEHKYVVEDFLGAGGMSCVFLATHQLLNKKFAIKILLPHLLGNSINVERFRQEAKATINLNHPNIINIFDCDISENGQPYIVMDYIDGMTLSTLIKQLHKIPPIIAINYFIQIADALEHAHTAKIIHRDLKPSNILLLNDKQQYKTVKILDFGIAKILEDDTNQVKLTQTGEVFGSPAYMSPEQVRGNQVDSRSDIYSFGCLMYETLTGSVPFSSSNLIETIQMHINDAPKPISQVVQDNSIPKDLELVVLKCLAKNPQQRFQSMVEIKNNLAQLKINVKDNFLKNLWLKLILFFQQKSLSSNSQFISQQNKWLIWSLPLILMVFLGWGFNQNLAQLPDLTQYYNETKILDLLQINLIAKPDKYNSSNSDALDISEKIRDRYENENYVKSSDFNLQEFLNVLIENAQLEFESGNYNKSIDSFERALTAHKPDPYDIKLEVIYSGLWQAELFKYLTESNNKNFFNDKVLADSLLKVLQYIKILNEASHNFKLSSEEIDARQKALVFTCQKLYNLLDIHNKQRGDVLVQAINSIKEYENNLVPKSELINFWNYELAYFYFELNDYQNCLNVLSKITAESEKKYLFQTKIDILMGLCNLKIHNLSLAKQNLELASSTLKLVDENSSNFIMLKNLEYLIDYEHSQILLTQYNPQGVYLNYLTRKNLSEFILRTKN